MELARRQLSYTKLTAPVAGAIATVDIEPNENTQAGQTIAQLTAGSKLEVEVAMPEILISNVREGDPVVVTFDALPGITRNARITEVGVASMGIATAFPVTVLVDDVHEGARPGMAAEVAFQFGTTTQREHFVVPSSAVGEDRMGRYVYVVEAAPDTSGVGLIHRRNVEIGAFTAEGIEILAGLIDSDFLVTAGVSRIEDGQMVQFQGEGKE